MTLMSYVLLVLTSLCPVGSVERGFVYCPAYPCICESREGALIINCRNLYLSALPKFLSFDGRIKELSLRYNSIRSLPADGFQGLNIEKLDLLDNAVTSIHEDAFKGLEHSLKALSIQLYALDGLPTPALSRLIRLQSLYVLGCKQQELYAELFQNLSQIEELHLVGCRIAGIKPGAFAPLLNLRILNLSRNSIRFQHVKEINVLENVLDLDLSSNDLQMLDNQALSRLSKLKYLKMAFNKMAFIAGGAFYNLDYCLEELDLQGNGLNQEALKSLRHLKTVRILNLSSNNISTLSSDEFIGLRYITTLNLANNGIGVVQRRSLVGLGATLSNLDLHGNPLELIESGAFSGFSKLERLNINTTKLGGSFRYETFIGVMTSLKYVDCSNSGIGFNDLSVLSCLVSLKEIDFSYNIIDKIDIGVFKSWLYLISANFSHNRVKEFTSESFILTRFNSTLQLLDLSWNKIQTIPDCAFFAFRDLVEVRLYENPLVCNCSLSWLFRWLQVTHSGPNEWNYKWECAATSHTPKKLFTELDISELKCTELNIRESTCLAQFNPAWRLDTTPTKATYEVKTTQSSHHVSFNITLPNPTSIQVDWWTKGTTEAGGYIVILKRCNDSYHIESVTTTPETNSHVFTALNENTEYEICIIMLADDFSVIEELCEDAKSSTKSGDSKLKEEQLYNMFHNSFIPLLLIYIAGSLALAFIVACVVVCIRKRQGKPLRIDPFFPGYPAWMDRSSMPSLSVAPDPHHFSAFYFDELGNQEQRDYHSQSTLMSGRSCATGRRRDSGVPGHRRDSVISGHRGDSVLVCEMPNIQVSRRNSRAPSNVQGYPYECSTLSSTIPKHLATEILAGRSEIDDEFYFHF